MATLILTLIYWYGYCVRPCIEDRRYSALERLLDEFFIGDMYYFIIYYFVITNCNQHCSGIFVIFTLGIFIVTVLIRRWFINYPQDQIIILRVVFDEVDEILSELPGCEGVRIIVILPNGRLSDGHPPPHYFIFFTQN